MSEQWIGRTDWIQQPTVAVGAVDLSPDPVASGEAVASPTLSPGAVSRTMTPIASSVSITSPSAVDLVGGEAGRITSTGGERVTSTGAFRITSTT